MLAPHLLKPLQGLVLPLFFKHKRLLLSLPRQEGKTELGVRINHDLLERPFAKSTLFLAKSRGAGKKAVREKFMRIFDGTKFKLNTESVVLKGCPTSVGFFDSVDKDPDRIRGGTYSYIHWSEVAFSRVEHGASIKDIFDKIIQPTIRKTKGFVLLESTNNGKNGWYDLWDNYKDFGFARFKMSLSDMADLELIPVEDYDEIKRTTQPDVFKQEYECEFVTFAGKAYAEFLESHIVEMESPKDWQKVIIGIDWGYDPGATCALFGYVEDGVTYIFDEHYEKKEMPIQTAVQIHHILNKHNVLKYTAVADHEQDRIDELIARGIECSKADKVDVLGNRLQVKEMFFKNQLYIHPRCKHLIKDLQSAVWDSKKDGQIDASQCSWGHFDAEAALRYLIRKLSGIEEEEPIVNPHMDQLSKRAWEMMQHRRAEIGYQQS